MRSVYDKEFEFTRFLEFVKVECKVLDNPVYSHSPHNEAEDRYKSNSKDLNRKFSGDLTGLLPR